MYLPTIAMKFLWISQGNPAAPVGSSAIQFASRLSIKIFWISSLLASKGLNHLFFCTNTTRTDDELWFSGEVQYRNVSGVPQTQVLIRLLPSRMHNMSVTFKFPCSGSVFIRDWEKSAKREPVTVPKLQVSF